MEGDGQAQTTNTFNHFLPGKPELVPDVGGRPRRSSWAISWGAFLHALPLYPRNPQEEDLLLGCKPQAPRLLPITKERGHFRTDFIWVTD